MRWPRASRRAPILGAAIVGAPVIHLGMLTQVSFFGGDWCWGPRYLLPLTPLWELALPFGVAKFQQPASLSWVPWLGGVLIRVMGMSMDHRFLRLGCQAAVEHESGPHERD